MNPLPHSRTSHRRSSSCTVYSVAEIYRPVFDPGEPSSTVRAAAIVFIALIVLLFAAAHFTPDPRPSSHSTAPPPPPQMRSFTSSHLENLSVHAAL